MDFNFYGHQLVIHLHPGMDVNRRQKPFSTVDGHDVPLPHYGVVSEWDDREALAARPARRKLEFIVEAHIRFQGQVGEQATMFLLDPSGNALEFKAFKDVGQLFAK
jgi:extradiol dioxygenase family protein